MPKLTLSEFAGMTAELDRLANEVWSTGKILLVWEPDEKELEEIQLAVEVCHYRLALALQIHEKRRCDNGGGQHSTS